MVFYPPELDPDTVYGPKEDLDDIIDSFGTVNAAALQAYYNWAVSMEQRVVTIQSDVSNYTKLFSDRKALDNLESAKASADRAKEMIGELKTICKADPAGTNVGQLETLGKGIWDSYQAALLYREAAKGYEAGQDAWANSTALDAWYSDLTGRRIYTGWSDTGEYNDSGSSVVWVGVAVGLVVGALVSFFLWSQLAKHMPRGGSKAMKRAKMIAPIVIALVVGVIIAIGAYFLTVEIALGVQSWIAGLGLFLG